MRPPPYTLLADAQFLANMAAKALQDSKYYDALNQPRMATFFRGEAAAFIISAKQIAHANKFLHQPAK